MTDLAESLVRRGVSVTALSGRGSYNGGARFPARENYKGVNVERAWSTGFGKGNPVKRLADYFSFYLGALVKLALIERHDIVMALTTPPLIALLAILIGRVRRMRVVALVQDFYPDIPIALGVVAPHSFVAVILEKLSRFVLRRADRIVVLGECMRERVVEKLGEEHLARIDVIHNWADGEKVAPLVSNSPNSFRVEHDLNDKFVVLFSGNFGRVNEFATVLKAAARLRDRTEIVFLFVGDGVMASEIKTFADANRLANVRLLPYQPRENLRTSLGAGDALLVTLAQGLAGLSVPSKTYVILAAGRPLLFVGDGRSDAARLVKRFDCGAVIESGDEGALAETILAWSIDKHGLAEKGRRARRAFEEHFDRPQAVNHYLATFSKCLGETAV